MRTMKKLLGSSVIIILALSIPQKAQSMEAKFIREKVNTPRLIVNLYENDQHRINEEIHINKELASIEMEGRYLWGYMTWIGAGAVEVSYVCAKALPYMIALTKEIVSPQTLTETILSPIYGTPARIERRDLMTSTMTQVQHVAEGIIEVSARLK